MLAISAGSTVAAKDETPSKHTPRMFALGNAATLQYQIVLEAPARHHLTEAETLLFLLSDEALLGRAPSQFPPRPTQTSEGRMYALQVH